MCSNIIYIYIYICGYLINYEYFNNLSRNEDMAETGMGTGTGTGQICTSPYSSSYPIEKSGIPHTHT